MKSDPSRGLETRNLSVMKLAATITDVLPKLSQIHDRPKDRCEELIKFNIAEERKEIRLTSSENSKKFLCGHTLRCLDLASVARASN